MMFLIFSMFSIFPILSMFSKLIPCSPSRNCRIPQFVEPWVVLRCGQFICKGEHCVHYLAIVGFRFTTFCSLQTTHIQLQYHLQSDFRFIDSSEFPSRPRASMIFLALMLGNFPHALTDFGENVSDILAPSDSLRPDHPTNLTFMELESL